MSTFPPRPCPCLCPLCGSLQVVQRCWGRKTGGFVGSLAGAAGGFAGSLRGAQIGGITVHFWAQQASLLEGWLVPFLAV